MAIPIAVYASVAAVGAGSNIASVAWNGDINSWQDVAVNGIVAAIVGVASKGIGDTVAKKDLKLNVQNSEFFSLVVDHISKKVQFLLHQT